MSGLQKMFNELARAEVGAKGSPLVFVSAEKNVQAVFLHPRSVSDAVLFAKKLKRSVSGEVYVEDSTGVIWSTFDED